MRDTKIIRICTKWFKYLYSNTRSWYGAMVQKLNFSLSHGSNQRRSEEERRSFTRALRPSPQVSTNEPASKGIEDSVP